MNCLKRILAATLAAALTLTTAACVFDKNNGQSLPPESQEPVDVNYPLDFDGIYIETMPARVLSLSPALTEIISELGYGDRLVGRTDFCDYPESVTALPSVGTVMMLDTDAAATLEPDLIVLQAPPTDTALTKLQQTGAAIVTLPRAYDIASTGDLYAKVFTLMEGAQQGVDKGAQYKAEFEQRIGDLTAAVKRAVSAQTDPPAYTGAYIVDTTSITATPDTYEGKLLETLGLENVATEGANWQFSHEKLTAAKPYILLCATGIDVEALANNKRLGGLGAVKKGRTYAVNSVILERQSPRMADELERLAKEIYPDLVLGAVSSEAEESSAEESSLGADESVAPQ